MPNRIPDVIGNQQGTGLVDGQPDRPSAATKAPPRVPPCCAVAIERVKIGTYGPCAEFIKTAPIGSARMRRFYFNLVHHDEVEPIGHPVADRGQAIAVAQRLAIDIAENRQDCLGKGYSVSIVDDAGIEIHRESVDSAEKSG